MLYRISAFLVPNYDCKYTQYFQMSNKNRNIFV